MKACKKNVLWNANYDRENNDYTNADNNDNNDNNVLFSSYISLHLFLNS